ncbi:tetratricopeptide (TPR) repeat protein [Actinokineospora baliensis]|uniref:hypothetical protein n=1 Tax=Actinokineospora baliensis TaxID=547056 RepID=UPI00195C52E8|nr:hypothetical protein [Actinokineospora baliensis]MBM7774828.1 tetratricopeptide (TPR) repeat protein [Actinokineospora baliensis]
MSIASLQPYLTAIAAVVSLTTLAMILRLSVSFRQAARDRAEVLEEKNKYLQEQLAASESMSKRVDEFRALENGQLKEQLRALLDDTGATLDALVVGKVTDSLEAGIRNSIESLVRRMETRQDEIADPAWHLELAKGHMVGHDWLQAAVHFGEYLKVHSDDPVVHFSRGVAFTNARAGRSTDLAAMLSYSQAVAHTADNDIALRALCLSRRGAMLKRLSRLDEAEADLRLALRWNSDRATFKDIWYNLACVHAMRGERDQLLAMVDKLKGSHLEISRIRDHLGTYFAGFAEDEEFSRAIGV